MSSTSLDPLPRFHEQIIFSMNLSLPHSIKHCLTATLIAFLAAMVVREGHAISGGELELPVSTTGAVVFSKTSGLDLRLDTRWAGVHGYRPVTCMVTARSPEPADRQIMIRFLASYRSTDLPAIVVEQHFELPANAMTASVKFLVPQLTEWRTVGCETFVNGVMDEELSINDQLLPAMHQGRNFTAFTIDDSFLIPRRLFRGVRGGPAEVYESPTGELLDKWIEYSSFDVVVTKVSDLKSEQASKPVKLAELLKWIRAGGNLWICSANDNYHEVPELDELLGLAEAGEGEPAFGHESLLARGWRFPKVDNPATDALEKLNQLYAVPGDDETNALDEEVPVDSRQWFATRPYGMGTVTMIVNVEALTNLGNTDQARGLARELAWNLTQSLLADRLSWEERHGTDPDGGNDNFNDFLIPDVGAAPVTAFQVLLSLFVLGIGPVNYFLLKKNEQLPLLLVTVPVAAMTATLLVLLYGFTSDGLGALVRVRSFTLLDQRTQAAASWSRLSYFAGMSPAEGFSFPDDTVVYPILPSMYVGDQREFRRFAGQRRDVLWNDDQHLINGWLASRTPTQYLSITSRETKKRVDIEELGTSMKAKNLLDANIMAIVVEDREGNFFVGKDIKAGQTALLEPSEQVKAISLLRNFISDAAPQFPPGTMESLPMTSGIELLPFSRNLMETHISAITGTVAKNWGPGSFTAITDRGIAVSLGMDDIEENSSFHIVRGIW
jgi:hypothetical protein